MNNTLEKVMTSKAVNKEAALVTSKGVHYETPKKLNALHSETPLKFSSKGFSPSHTRQINNVIGIKFGRFTVIGLYPQKKKKKTG